MYPPRTTIHAVSGAIFRIPNNADERLAIFNRKMIVRITGDALGIALSISDEDNGGAMYAIPLEPIASRLKEVLKNYRIK